MWKKYRALLRKFINYISNSIRIRKKATDNELVRSIATITRDDQKKLTLNREENLLIDKEKNLEKTNITDNTEVVNDELTDETFSVYEQKGDRIEEILDDDQDFPQAEDQQEVLIKEEDDQSESIETVQIEIMCDVQEEVELSDENKPQHEVEEPLGAGELVNLPDTEISPRIITSQDISQVRRKKKFQYDYKDIPSLPDEELQRLIELAQTGALDNEFGENIDGLEIFLLNAFQNFEFIGEFPLSNDNFKYFCKLIQNRFIRLNRLRVSHVPPALYVTSMVFCARYTEEDARNFWTPYAKLVWNTTSGQYFQNKCRDHFIDSKLFLIERFEFSFPTISKGGVVRPVYFQAIIPYYLQSHFADWLVDQFEQILQYSVDELPEVLKRERSLNSVPPGLRRFVQGADTADAAAKLIQQMAKAVWLFQETEQFETVSSVMDSPIEKELWKEIYDELIERELSITKIRKFTPKLNWVYDCENEEFSLRLSQLRSEKNEKPNLIIWAEKGSQNLKDEDVLIRINPWKFTGGDWKLDPTSINAKGDLSGRLYVLSDEFDLERDVNEQQEHVIYENDIPKFDADILYFFLSSKRTDARIRDNIDFDGEWIIFSRYKFDFTNEEGVSQEFQAVQIPEILRKNNYVVGRRYTLPLPTTLISGEIKTLFTRSEKASVINADIVGEDCITGLSDIVQPIFCSSNLKIHLHAQILNRFFQRVWISLHRGGQFIASISFAELEQRSLLLRDEDEFTIDLSSYISQPGLYTLSILHNLQSLLEENLEFAYLPQIKIIGPDPEICYSPVNPLEVFISGIEKSYISTIEHEIVEIIEDQDQIKIIWKRLKEETCRFTLQWEGNVIHFAWDINRVTAWIEGGGDKYLVKNGHEDKISLHVRANAKEAFSWKIEGNDLTRKTAVDFRGEFSKYLSQTVLRDMLKTSNKVTSRVFIYIRDFEWNVFSYIKTPNIQITSLNYIDSQLSMTISQSEILTGAYTVQLIDKYNPITGILLEETDRLKNEHKYDKELTDGTYFVELLLVGERISRSEDIQVTQDITKTEETDILINVDDFDIDGRLFHSLSADYKSLSTQADLEGENIIPILKQIIAINNTDTWVCDEKQDDGLKLLLPSWAVLKHPLILSSKEYDRSFFVYPQESVFCGKAGKGYMTATIEREQIKLYAAWNTDFNENQTSLWLMVPQDEDFKNHCELDEHDLWPAYQCVDCGIIVGSKNGSYIRLSPSTTISHKHARNRMVKGQFIDVVYDYPIDVNVFQNRDKNLAHCYSSKNVVGIQFIDKLVEGKIQPVSGDLDIPVCTSSDKNYLFAVSEVVENYQNPSKKIILQQIISDNENIEQITNFLIDNSLSQPAFSALLRLTCNLGGNHRLAGLPLHELLLALILRLKPRNLDMYDDLLTKCNLTEDDLIRLTLESFEVCPKLLEWAIAWVEIFYTHTLS